MSDLAIDIAVTGIENVKAMGLAFDSMLNAFNAAKEATPNLKKLEDSIKGVGSGAGQLDAVLKEIRELATVSGSLATTMRSGFDSMNKHVAHELEKLKIQVNATVDELSGPGRKRVGKGPLASQVEADALAAKVAAKAAAADIAKNAMFMTATPAGQSRLAAKASTAIGLDMSTADAVKAYGSAAVAAAANSNNLGNALKSLTLDGNNAHSMARGLASGFNLLWLTWGNLVPLFAGAAISNGFMQTVKIGAQVEHTLATIAVLGGNTASEMRALNEELIRLGNSGPAGPVAIAEAMKVLSLAGLKANEILAVTQTVLNFSVAGNTDLRTAADTLVSISTAFGMGAEGFARVSDVVSKAAAESKSSVESFAGAMKTASVINAQYGVSLVDTATGIATLSQLGIEGSAAGTALRNMYSDLSGRSKEVTKVLQAQGIEMRTATGEFRPMLEVVADLNTKLQKLDGIGQKNLLQALLSERGAKGIVEMLRLVNTEAKDAGSGMANALAEMRAKIEESYGFAAVSAAKLSQTTQKQFEAVKATLQTSMVQAFDAVAPSLLLISDGLRQAFGSPEFVNGLTALVSGVAQLALTVIENARVIGAATAAYVAYRLLTSGLAIELYKLSGILGAKTAATVADTAATNASTAAQLANNGAKAASVGVMGTLARLIPFVGTAITVATSAWIAYEWYTASANNTSEKAAGTVHENLVKSLKEQAQKIRDLNDLRSQGLTLSQAQEQLDNRKAKKAAVAPYEENTNKAIKDAATVQESLTKLLATPYAQSASGAKAVQDLRKTLNERLSVVNEFKTKERNVTADVEREAASVVAAQKESDLAEEKRLKDKLANRKVFGTGTFERFSPSATGANQPHKDALADLNNKLNEFKRVEQTKINEQQNTDKVTEAMYKIGALRDDEYTARKLASIAKIEKEQIDSLQKQVDAIAAAKADPALNKNASDASRLDAQSTTATEALKKANAEAKAREEVLAYSQFEATHAQSEKLIKDLQKEIETQKLKNDEIGKTPAQIELQRAKVAELRAEQMKSDIAFFESFLARKEGEQDYIDLTKEGRAGYEAMLDNMRSELRLAKELATVRSEASTAESISGLEKFGKTFKKKTRYEGLEDDELQGVIGVETAKIRVYERTAKREIELRQQVSRANLAAAIAAAPDGQLSEKQLQEFADEARAYQEIIDTIDKDVAIKVSIAGKEDIATELQKISDGISKAFGGPAQAALDELTAASSRAGSQYASVFKARIKDAEDYVKSINKVSTAFGSVSKATKSWAEAQKVGTEGSEERAQAQIGAYGDMAGAAAEFFDKNSEGYAIMKAAEQGFRIFQMVSSIAAMGQKAAEVTAGMALDTAATGPKVMSGVAGFFASMGPFAFPAIAAMLAVMASVGFGGGGSSGSFGVTGPGNQIGMDGRKAVQTDKDLDGPSNYDSATGNSKQNRPQKTEQEMIDFANAAALDAAANALNNLKIEAMELTKGSEELEKNLARVKFAVGGSGQGQYELATQGMTAAEKASYDYNQALLGQTQVLLDIANGTDNASENMKKLAGESEKLSIDLLRAQGRIAEANAAQAAIDTRGYTKEEVAMYNYIQSQKEQVEAANAGASAARDAAQAEEDLAQKRYELAGKLDVLLGRRTQIQVDREAALVGVTDEATLSLMALVNSIEDLHTNADVAFAALQRAVEAEKKIAAANLKLAQELASALKSTKEAIAVGISRSTAQSQIAGYLATVRAGGSLPALDALKPSLTAISKPSQDLFATFLEYQRDQIRTANDIAELSEKADQQVSIEQQNIDRLDALVTAAQAQLDALKGIDTSVISSGAAFANFTAAMLAISNAQASTPAYSYPAPVSSGGGGSAGGGGSSSAGGGGGASSATAGMDSDIVAAYAAYYSRDPDQEGYDNFVKSKLTGDKLMQAILFASTANRAGEDYARALANGYNPEDPAAHFYKAKKKAATSVPLIEGSFAVGSNYIPKNMYAEVHEGEEITPRPYVDIQSAAREETNKLLKELMLVTREQAASIKLLKEEITEIKKSTKATKDYAEKNDQIGTPPVRTA